MRRKILGVGAAIIPYLDELRPAATPEMAIRLESVAGELRFQDLRRDFVRLSLAKLPDLEDGAILISRFGFADVDGAVYRDWLDKVAAAVSADMPSDAGIGESVRRLSNHLFQSLGFAGNETRYYDADNSYLSRVIDTRRGIPVTLTVLMLLLARRLRLPLYGVGTPGHFLAGFKEGGSALFVDCFAAAADDLARGQAHARAQRLRVARNSASPSARATYCHMLHNLISIYQKTAADRREALDLGQIVTRRDGAAEALSCFCCVRATRASAVILLPGSRPSAPG